MKKSKLSKYIYPKIISATARLLTLDSGWINIMMDCTIYDNCVEHFGSFV